MPSPRPRPRQLAQRLRLGAFPTRDEQAESRGGRVAAAARAIAVALLGAGTLAVAFAAAVYVVQFVRARNGGGGGGAASVAAREHLAGAALSPPLRPPPAPSKDILTVIASKNTDVIARFRSPLSDMVLFDYSPNGTTACEWCVHIQRGKGVKWELLGAFLGGDWWAAHRSRYTWLWYPDDDLVFEPGGVTRFLSLAAGSGHFALLQPALCAGSKFYHPEYLQDAELARGDAGGGGRPPIVHIHTVELQMPLGRTSWWQAEWDTGHLKGQRFGYAVDLIWARRLRNEARVGVVNAVCALHPYRPPAPSGTKHISGLDDNSLGLTDHDLWLEYKANKAKYGVDYGKKPEFRYFARYLEAVRPLGAGRCEDVCRREADETCVGALPPGAAAGAHCALGEAEAAAANWGGDVDERACGDDAAGVITTRHSRSRLRRGLLAKKKKAQDKRAKSGGGERAAPVEAHADAGAEEADTDGRGSERAPAAARRSGGGGDDGCCLCLVPDPSDYGRTGQKKDLDHGRRRRAALQLEAVGAQAA